MALKSVHSRDNPFVKRLRRLAESARERQREGRTLLDGMHLITAYEGLGGPVETLVVSETGAGQEEIAAFLAGREAVCLPDSLLRSLGLVDNPSGILALAPIPAPAGGPDPELDSVLLDGLQDPGNVGTLIRTAAAAGFGQILLSADCAGAWSPKVLRAGQGAHFAATIHENADLPGFLAAYRGTSAATTLADALSLYAAPLAGPVAWVFGSEGQGVRPAVLAQARLKIRIPMPGRVESLNVGAAAAICLFETLRRRGG